MANLKTSWGAAASLSNSDIVAFGGIDRELPNYRLLPGIVEGALQNAAL